MYRSSTRFVCCRFCFIIAAIDHCSYIEIPLTLKTGKQLDICDDADESGSTDACLGIMLRMVIKKHQIPQKIVK